MVKAAGLGHVRFYDLRHSAEALLFRAGVPAAVVAAHLGHARVEPTLNTYTHLAQSMQNDTADAMERVLAGSRRRGKTGESAECRLRPETAPSSLPFHT